MKPPLTKPATLAIGWALFLACSWTWCIGMFLPVLLVRDYGFAGWAVFAAPNIIGAAALGWVLARPGAARRVAEAHQAAALAFSGVTIAFHCFFAAWVLRALVGNAGPAALAIVALLMALVMRGGRRELLLAAGVFALSVAAFVAVAVLRGVASSGLLVPPIHDGRGLLWLSPVVVFGFLLCPYLDLTFLRARALTEARQGIAAFTLGFGAFFLVMIFFTLFYAPLLRPDHFGHVPASAAWLIAGHMIFQSAYTIALHARPLAAADASKPIRLATPMLCLAAFVAGIFALPDAAARSAFSGESIYRMFMGFYGLVFPAYVWLCMIPPRGQTITRPTRRGLTVFVAAVIAALPMFWLGFICGKMIWLVPGLIVVLLARLLVIRPVGRAVSGPIRAEAAVSK